MDDLSPATPPPSRTLLDIKRRKTRKTLHSYHPKKELVRNASHPSRLVPIKLDIEVDGARLRDSFVWNLNETLINPEQFARIMVDDLEGPFPSNLVSMIAQEIRSQCEIFGEAAAPEDLIEEEEDVTIIIKLDLDIDKLHLKDQFEWSLYSKSPTPEDFARQLCADLGLGGQFTSLIAHSIREQVCYAILNFEEVIPAPTVPDPPFRFDEEVTGQWVPSVSELDEAEIERRQLMQERANRRRRRATRATKSLI